MTDSSKLWKLSRALTGKNIQLENHTIQDPNGTVVYTNKNKADIIANTLKIRFETNNLPRNNINQTRDIQSVIHEYFNKPPRNLISFVTPSELKNIIKNLKTKKAPGPDHYKL